MADREKLLEQSRMKGRDISRYKLKVSQEEARNIEKFYIYLINKVASSWDVEESDYDYYKFNSDHEYQRYEFVGGNNCVTVLIDALESTLDDDKKFEIKHQFAPAGLHNALNGILSRDNIIKPLKPYFKNNLVAEYTYYPRIKADD